MVLYCGDHKWEAMEAAEEVIAEREKEKEEWKKRDKKSLFFILYFNTRYIEYYI